MPGGPHKTNIGNSWLPRGAFNITMVDRAVASLVRSWSEKWFTKIGPRPLGSFRIGQAPLQTAKKPQPGDEMHWLVLPGGVALGVANRAVGVLASSILDADLSGNALTPKDRGLIDRLTATCLDDLRNDLARLFGAAPDTAWRPEADFAVAAEAWTLPLGLKEREPLIRLAAEPNAIVAFRKSRISGGVDPIVIGRLADALEKQPITLSARVGRCAMTLSDFTALSEGDVVVLDRALQAPLELAVDGQVKSGGCFIEEEEDRLLLKISTPIHERANSV